MDKIEIKFNDTALHFSKYGERMFQQAFVFLNDKKIDKYELIVNLFLDDTDHLNNYITIDNYNYNNEFKNRGLATKAIDMLIDFYNKQGFNKFALVIENEYENGKKIEKISKKFVKKFNFEFKEEINSKNNDFTLDVFEKIYPNNYILKGKDNYEKEMYFRTFAGSSLISQIELKASSPETESLL